MIKYVILFLLVLLSCTSTRDITVLPDDFDTVEIWFDSIHNKPLPITFKNYELIPIDSIK